MSDIDQEEKRHSLTVQPFYQMWLTRMLQEHEILELYFVNDRWMTRVHRSVIFLARIALKITVVGTFFIVSFHRCNIFFFIKREINIFEYGSPIY